MKRDIFLGAILLGSLSLIACGGGDPTTATEPAAATATPTPDPAAPTDTTSPPPSGAAFNTCERLAAAPPAGVLATTEVNSSFKFNPTDVYATVTARGLTIALTEAAHECDYRSNRLAHMNLNELRITVPKKTAAFASGTFEAETMDSEAGKVCVPESPGDTGTASASSRVQGNVTITAIDATSVTGSIDINDSVGKHTTFTFTAPICGEAPSEQDLTCCAQ